MNSPKPYFSQDCVFIEPEPGTNLCQKLGRWSNVNLDRPAIVVVPDTIADVTSAIQYAVLHHLQIVPGGGGHGVAVPIHGSILYLDMRKFNDVTVDAKKHLVTLGGGATNEEVLAACIEHGHYAVVANSGAVGMVGMVLSGGFSPLSGMHGLPIDHVQSLEVVTASGKILHLDGSSKGELKALFTSLCGGGNGLCVVTKMTLRIFPISLLNLEEGNRIWTRKIVFPETAIEEAVKIFMHSPTSSRLQLLLMLARAPSSTPSPGQPLIILTATYYGPASEAEALMSGKIEPKDLVSAISDSTIAIPFDQFFEGTKDYNTHGDFKEANNARTMCMSHDVMVKAFKRWRDFGDQVDDARAHTIALFLAYDPTTTMKNGACNIHKQKPFVERNRPFFSETIKWYSLKETKNQADRYGTEMMAIIREKDESLRFKPIALPNTMPGGSDLGEGYSAGMIREMRRLKSVWDKNLLFCSLEGS